MKTAASLIALLAASAPALAGVSSINLSQYQLVSTYNLSAAPFFPASSEASAITYNWDTGTLFILGDEGDAILEINTDGSFVSTMNLTGFADTEGLTYIGNGQFAIGEERLQDVYRFTYTAGASVDRAALAFTSVGPTVGNIGIEGFSYDPSTGRFLMVKEKTPLAVYDVALPFAGGTDLNPSNLFDPTLLGLADLSDIQVLSTVPSLAGTAAASNLLIYSQESARLLEVTRTGQVLSSFDFSGIASNAEGVTVGPDGTIYIAGEDPAVYVLQIPAPGAAGLAALAMGLAARRRR
ncbi:MAG: SdiA-regulated domain-containing protein [Planctomycetota bacterium]|nr:SdiA-regulated domain-containing protein [Planctomycetota bacterium]